MISGISIRDIFDATVKIVKYLFGIKKKALKSELAIIAAGEIVQAMNEVVSETRMKKISLYKLENGGGNLTFDCKKNSSVILEMVEDPYESSRRLFQKIEIDEDYINYIRLAMKNGMVKISTPDIRQNTVLSSMFEDEGTKYCEIHYISARPTTAIYFIKVCSNEEIPFLESIEKLILSVSINNIKNIIKNNLK